MTGLFDKAITVSKYFSEIIPNNRNFFYKAFVIRVKTLSVVFYL